MPNTLSEEQREVLNDLISSPGWWLFTELVLPTALQKCVSSTLDQVRVENLTQAARMVGKYEGALGLVRDAYQLAKSDIPQHIKELTRGNPNG